MVSRHQAGHLVPKEQDEKTWPLPGTEAWQCPSREAEPTDKAAAQAEVRV